MKHCINDHLWFSHYVAWKLKRISLPELNCYEEKNVQLNLKFIIPEQILIGKYNAWPFVVLILVYTEKRIDFSY